MTGVPRTCGSAAPMQQRQPLDHWSDCVASLHAFDASLHNRDVLSEELSVAWIDMVTLSAERRVALHRRALWLEYFTVGWNVVEALVAIGAGVIAGSVALIGFGADSAIEVISAVGLLWRLRKAGPHAAVSEESAAEKRALYVVAITFFLLALYITWEALNSLISREEPLTSGLARR
jgi:hypothetical protein